MSTSTEASVMVVPWPSAVTTTVPVTARDRPTAVFSMVSPANCSVTR